MEFDGNIAGHGVIFLSNTIKKIAKPSRSFLEIVKTGWGGVNTINFDGWVCFEIPTLVGVQPLH